MTAVRADFFCFSNFDFGIVVIPKDRVACLGAQSGHVEGLSDCFASAVDCSLATHPTAVSVDWNSKRGRDFL